MNRHVANMEKGCVMGQSKMEDIISLCKTPRLYLSGVRCVRRPERYLGLRSAGRATEA